MSTVSGLASKGEKGSKQKFSALNINNLYKGKSLENPKTTVAPKHGLQTLGKVGAGRRIPPPANLPSLKSENAGNTASINLVPSGGQGWVKEKEDSVCSIPVSSASLSTPRIPSPKLSSDLETTASSTSSTTLTPAVSTAVASNANVVATGAASAAASKTWSSVTSFHEDDGQDKNFLAHQSPFFPQEFPKLDGGAAPEGETLKQSVDSTYGPGPSLRPQTEGSWTRGTATQQYSGNQQPNNGSGVNGQPVSPSESDLSAAQRPYQPQMAQVAVPRGPVPPNIPIMNSGAVPTAQNMLPAGHTPMMPLSPQYRPLVSPYIYNRNSGFPTGYPSPTQLQNYPPGAVPRQAFQYPEPRMRQHSQQIRSPEEDGSYQRPTPPILTDKDLKGFDEILENETYDEWALANTEIDYNAKLVFSDDEENGSNKDYKGERKAKDEQTKGTRKDGSKRDSLDRESEKDGKPRYRPPQQWQSQVSRHYDYRGPPTGPPHQTQYTTASANYPSIRNRSELPDEDEMWRQRSRQHSDEMTAAVVRARQRREEEEKKFEQSRQAAQEKAKALEEKVRSQVEKEKENTDSDDRSSHGKDNREDKLNKDFRGAVNYNAGFASKQFPKNIPPRFQKLQQQQQQQQQQQMQQQQQQQMPNSVSHFGNRYEALSNTRIAPHEQTPYGYLELKTQQGFNKAGDVTECSGHPDIHETHGHSRDRHKHLPDNWRSHKESAVGRSGDKVCESLRGDRGSADENQIRVQPRNLLQREDNRVGDSVHNAAQRPDSRSSFSSREESRRNVEDKKPSFERQESSQSSQSDKLFDDKPKKYERLDWASECDNVSVGSSNSSHFGSFKKDWHRPVPVVQKHLNAGSEPAKINLTTLKKEELKKDRKGDTARNDKKDETVTALVSDSKFVEIAKDESRIVHVDENKDVTAKCDNRDIPPTAMTTDSTAKKYKESISKASEKTKNEASQEKKSVKHEDERSVDTRTKERDSHYDPRDSRDYNFRHSNFRGRSREYRNSRTRGMGDKLRQDKYSRGATHRKLSKSRKQSHNSDESLTSLDTKRDKEGQNHKASQMVFESSKCKTEYCDVQDKYQQSNSNSSKDEQKKGRGVTSFKSSTRGMARTYGPSNYGPPPSKAAFGDTKNVCKLGDQSEAKKDKQIEGSNDSPKTDVSKSSSKDGSNNQSNSSVRETSSTVNANKNSSSMRNQKDANYRKANAPPDPAAHRGEEIPPRFQRKHGNYRSGKDSKHQSIASGRGEHGRRQRAVINQESDIGNDEWETASESSDFVDRKERRSELSVQHSKRNESKGHRRNDRRKDSGKSHHSSAHRGQSNGNNSGEASSPNANRQSALKNGPLSLQTKGDTTVLTLNNVIMDNPRVVGDAIVDLKQRQKSSKSKSQPSPLNVDIDEGFQKVSYRKRNKVAVTNENKKLKEEAMITKQNNARMRYTKLPPRLAKQKENTRFGKLEDDESEELGKEVEIVKETKESFYTISSKVEKDVRETKSVTANAKVEQSVSAWNKPLSHAIQAANSIVVTTVAGVNKPSKNNNQQPLSLSSKSSSFDQQDSGIDVSDQQASAASSQRSSPSNDDNNKPVAANSKTAPNVISTSKEIVSDLAEELDTGKPMCTVIFQNKSLKAENAVLDKFGKPQDNEMEISTSKQISTAEDSTKGIASLSNECKETFTELDEDQGSAKLNFDFNEEKSSSAIVNKAVGTPRSSGSVDVAKSSGTSPSADELNQHLKIASVKKVWENHPSMPAVLENSGEECVASVSLPTKYDNQKAISTEASNTLTSLSSANTPIVSAHTWGNVRHVPLSNQEVNKVKPHHYSQAINNQIAQQSLLFSSSPPNHMANHMSSPLDSLRQISNYHMTVPPISSPPNLIYNTQPQMTASAPNIYSFAHQMKNFPQVMAQIAAAPPTAYHPQHLMSHQNNTIGQQNIYMPNPSQTSVNPTAADRYRVPTHQQNLAASHLLKSQFVQASTQGLHRIPVATSTAFYSNQAQAGAAGYYQQTNAGSTLQQQQYGYASAQPLITASASQVAPQQSYRTVPVAIGRTDNSSTRPPNGKYNYR